MVSLLDQYREAKASAKKYGAIENPDEEQQKLLSGAKAAQAQAGIGMGLAGLNALSGIVGATSPMGQIADTNMQQDDIDYLSRVGASSTGSYDQLTQEYSRLNDYQPDLSWDTIRGGSNAERIGTTLSAIGQGASAGNMIGGPIGAAVGGLVGGGIAAYNWISGNKKADEERARLRREYNIAQQTAITNLNAGAENIQDRNFRSQLGNIAADGGRISRQQSLNEFADRLLKGSKKSVSHSANIIRIKQNGGTCIRIKIR